MLFLSWVNPYNSDKLQLNYVSLDEGYTGKLAPVYGYSATPEYQGFFTLPIQNQTTTTGQVQFIDVTDPKNPVTLKTDSLTGLVGNAMDLTDAQKDLDGYLSSDGKYVLADGDDAVDGQNKIIPRNFTDQVAGNTIVIRLTHIQKFLAHSNMIAIHGHLIVNGEEDSAFSDLANDLGNGEYGTTYIANLATQKIIGYETDLTSELNNRFANLKGIDAHASFDQTTGILTVTYDPTTYVKNSGEYTNYDWDTNPAKQTLTIDFSRTIPYVHIGTGFSGSTIPDIPADVGVIKLNGKNLPFIGVNTDPGIELYWYLNQVQKADLKIVDQDAAGYNAANPYDNPAINISGITTTFNASGKAGSQINFDQGTTTVQNSLKALEDKGYELVSNSLKPGTKFDNDGNADQHFVIVLKHQHQDITPDQDTDNLVKTVTRTIDYRDTAGNEVKGSPDDTANYTQQVYFVRTAVKDLVTQDILGYDLNGDGQVDIPVKFGDQAWQAAVKSNDNKYVVNADANQFAAVNSKAPQSVGYDNVNLSTVDGHSVAWNSPDETVHVIYSSNPKPIKEQGSIKVTYFDDTTHQSLTKVGDKTLGFDSGKQDSGTAVSFADHDAQLKALTDNGYVVVSDPTVNMPNQIGNNDLLYTIHVVHQIIPVTPDNPGNGLTKDQLTKTVTETVTYEGADAQTPTPVKTSLTFNGIGYYDAVTGKWTDALGHELTDQTKNITWTAENGNKFAVVVTPHIEGYTSTVPAGDDDGNGNVKEFTGINQNSRSINVVVTYHKIPGYTNGTPETKMVTRTINYLDSKTHQPIPTDLAPTVTQHVEFTRTPVLDANGKIVAYGTVSPDGKSYTQQGWTADGDWARVISPDLTSHGYTAPSQTDVAQAIPDANTEDQTVNVYYGHQVVPVTPDKPGNGLTKDQLTKTVKETVHYTGAGTQTPSDNVTQLHFTGTGYYDAVTNKWTDASGNELADQTKNLTWTTNDGHSFAVVVTPHIDGYTSTVQDGYDDGNGNVKAISGIDQNSGDINVTVTYTPTQVNDQTALVKYVDSDESNRVITTSGDLTGKPGEQIDYSTAQTIQNLEKKGYALVTDGFPAGATYDNDDSTVQTYLVVLKHTTTTVTPDKPGTPDQPVDPSNPDGPKYPDGTDINSLKKTGTQTIHYVGAGDQNPADNKQSFDFTKTITFDNVTGKIISDSGWNVTSHTFGRVDTPVVQGYHADKASAGETTVTPTDLTKEVIVNYAPNGKIIPVDPNDQPIPDAPTPQYPTDPTDPTKVTPDEPVPTIPGRTPDQPTVTPTDPGKDTHVIYRVPTKDEGVVNVIVHDTTTGQNLPDYDWTSGTQETGTAVDYNKAATLTNLRKAGYKVINPDVTIPSEIAKGTVNVVIYVEHQIIPVTPDKPGNGLKDTDLTKTVTETVHYTGAGDQTPADKTAQLHFTGTGYYDAVTGKWTDASGHELADQTKNLTWTAKDGQNFAVVVTPHIDGYTSTVQDGYDDGNGNVKAISGIDQTSNNIDVTVTYTKAPNYRKGQPQFKTVTRTINYIDSTTGQPIPANLAPTVVQNVQFTRTPILDANGNTVAYGTVSDDGNSYALQDWTADGDWARVISPDLTKDGYTAPSQSDVAKVTPGADTENQTVNVYYGHQVVPVTPDKPGNGLKDTDLTKTVTETVHYTGAGNQTPADYITQLHFTGTGYYDAVTGKWTDASGKELTDQTKNITWTANDGRSFAAVATPHINGYTSMVQTGYDDGAGNVKAISGIDQNSNDINVTVTYTPMPVNDQTALVKYVDSDEGNRVITTSGDLTGKPGEQINYSTTQTIQNLEKKGYALVNDGFPIGATYDHDDGTVQTYLVVLKHTTTTVTPDKPGTPDQPVDP
ncbi:mucin-binding protein, partial [Limosilactobacillus sp.]|uniref:mucin-binding protein n=1 Tax=Limosilactobacillus sp. TaxID=2773925 RepID=UPI003F05F54B